MTLLDKDRTYVWHPLTQHGLDAPMLPIQSSVGSVLTDCDGKEYIDGISSWYTAIYGHRHPAIIQAVQRQMQELDQVVFAGLTHAPAVELAETLIQTLPSGQAKVFYNDNGSTATEIGIKMALQYHHNQGNKRKTLLAFEEGFHGDTFGAMSASGLSVYNGAFREHFLAVERLPVPDGNNTQALLDCLERIHRKTPLAGFLYEPLVQGAAAMKLHDVAGLEEILRFCKAQDILLIADEVMTGFGKTGKTFASDYVSVKPDIICLSKALTAGLLPMGATTCSQKVFDAFYDTDLAKGLFHGHTYTANPLACAAARAGIALLQTPDMQANINRLIQQHQNFATELAVSDKVENIRQLGVILAFDLKEKMGRYGSKRERIYQYFLEKGIFLRPLGNTLYLMPPYVTTDEQLLRLYDAIREFLKQHA